MTNTFAENYAKHQEIKARYEAAKEQNNEAGMTQARNDHRDFEAQIEANGDSYVKVYCLYSDARDAGNDYIDISECYQYRDEAALIASLRECGIEAFTFSSGWSSAVDSAWAFIQLGCTLQGMVQINAEHIDYMTGEHEKRNTYLFKL